MRQVQDKRRGNRRPLLALLVVFGASVFLASSISWAEPPDSAKPGLKEGVFIPMYRDTTKRQRSPVALAALERLKENTAEKWGVIWDDYIGLPRTVTCATKKTYLGEATDIAVAFVEDHKELFTGINDPQLLADYSFGVDRIKTLRLETAVTLNSYYRGVKIFKGILGVFVSKEGLVKMVNNSFKPLILVGLEPSLTKAEAEAEALALQATTPDSITIFGEGPELYIYPSSPPRLVYAGFIMVGLRSWEIIIDAHNAELVLLKPLSGPCPKPTSSDSGATSAIDSTGKKPTLPRLPVYPSPGRDSVKKREDKQPKSSRWSHKDLPVFSRVPTDEKSHPTKETPASVGTSEAQSCCWFFEPNIAFEPVMAEDQDGDGFTRLAYMQWDADTYPGDSALIKVVGYGCETPGSEYEVFESGPWPIYGLETDIYSVYFSIPFQGEWSFRLELTDQFDNLLDEYPGDATMTDIPMESPLEDLYCVLAGAWPYEHLDLDNDGYDQMDTLVWRMWVEDYDTSGLFAYTLKMYGRDEGDGEMYLGETDTFFAEADADTHYWTLFVAGHHGLWDYELELINSFGDVADSIPYGLRDTLVDMPMELWIEDPPITVVFDPNPVNVLFDPFLEDQNDWMYAVPSTAYSLVFLQGLDPPVAGYYWLEGEYVLVNQIQGPPKDTPPAKAPEALGPIFPYLRSDDQFEQVMCYYHIDRNQRYIQSLGFASACNRQIEVDAAGMAGADTSAYYALATGDGPILFGSGGVDDAEDADIILHEYGHAIMDN